ncbi:hypothetical protein ABIQ69_00550 [Agromyces sp. G08B096]|uniref:DUF7144 domain-containing protein n=1 Tax=Agromyces sp. G08B096 TaxID=3156399 RepID=A0AAU7W7J4_9MICO
MSDVKVSGWAGWGVFAAIMLILAGSFDMLYGFIALALPDSAYLQAPTGALLLFDVAGWGWWHVISGALLVLVGAALFSGAAWARVAAVILVTFNAIGQLALLPVQPWWSLIVLSLDILVIYAITVHGRDLIAAGPGRRRS